MMRFDGLAKQLTYDNKETCIRESKRPIKNNTFNSSIPAISVITLSTQQQLEDYLYPRIEHFHKNRSKKCNKISTKNLFYNTPELFSDSKLPIYSSKSKEATYNTIDYIFKVIQKGIFVQILDNKIKTFVSIKNYESSGFDVSKHLKTDPSKYKDLDDFIQKINKSQYDRYKLVKLQEDSIYFTDCSISLWEQHPISPGHEADWIYTYQYHMLEELLKVKKINDVEFILNFKDLNMLTKDGESYPHFNILGNLTTPMKRKSKEYIPILNIGSHKKFADLAMPTNDDWEIITNKIFLGLCRDAYLDVEKHINTNFDSKIPTAIFRGGATGCGTIIKNNPRLKAAYLTNKFYRHAKYGVNGPDGLYLDARLVSYKVKLKKHYSDKYIRVIDPKSLPMRLTKKMSFGEISNYKYVISIEGNIAQFRLTLELAYNSVILLVKSDFYIWYQPLLKPWVHYVPVKADLSDLMDKIEWCKKHDSKCKEIASNARMFYKTYINRDSVYDYMECLINF